MNMLSDEQYHVSFSGNCAFILPDLKPERYHEFRVFTKNKYGDNYDKSVFIAVGERQGRRKRQSRENSIFNFNEYLFSRFSGGKNTQLLALYGSVHHWCMPFVIANYLLLLSSYPSIDV